jgi:hypothetical protein
MDSSTPLSMMHSSFPRKFSLKLSVTNLHLWLARAMTMLFMPVLLRLPKESTPIEFSLRSRWISVVFTREMPRKQMADACRWFCPRWSSSSAPPDPDSMALDSALMPS